MAQPESEKSSMNTLEQRFLVLKLTDIEDGLAKSEQELLRKLVNKIQGIRAIRAKPVHSYVVINQDEPYFSEVLKLMEVEK